LFMKSSDYIHNLIINDLEVVAGSQLLDGLPAAQGPSSCALQASEGEVSCHFRASNHSARGPANEG
jgi:hypothetical protein